MEQGERENHAIAAECAALFETLSELGRRVTFPPDIPFQAAEARDKELNDSIRSLATPRSFPTKRAYPSHGRTYRIRKEAGRRGVTRTRNTTVVFWRRIGDFTLSVIRFPCFPHGKKAR